MLGGSTELLILHKAEALQSSASGKRYKELLSIPPLGFYICFTPLSELLPSFYFPSALLCSSLASLTKGWDLGPSSPRYLKLALINDCWRVHLAQP